MHFFWTIIFNTGIGRVCGGLNDHIVMKTYELDGLLMESVDLERRQPRRLFRARKEAQILPRCLLRTRRTQRTHSPVALYSAGRQLGWAIGCLR